MSGSFGQAADLGLQRLNFSLQLGLSELPLTLNVAKPAVESFLPRNLVVQLKRLLRWMFLHTNPNL